MNKISVVVLSLLAVSAVDAVRAEDSAVQLKTLQVIGVSPLGSGELDVDNAPANIQTVTSEQLEKSQSLSLAEYMNRYMGSVFINEAQNNPLQPDVYYRGFVASPLLGMPQGMSVYVDGVRFNEPFGDTVNWDLLPPGAMQSMALIPGSNPVYGLNSLGGAISVKTKTGFSAPGHQLEVYGGSWGRHSVELTSGWNNGEFGYFLDLRNFGEKGWRDHSRSKANQLLGSLSWQGDRGALDLTIAANDNKLKGNGALPVQLYEQSREAVFTFPDQTETNLFFANLAGNYLLSDRIELRGNAYYRRNDISTFNGDDSDYEACEQAGNAGLLCEEPGDDEEVVEDIDGNPVAADDAVEGATNNFSDTEQYSTGGTLQGSFTHDLFGFDNNLVVGAVYDYANIDFASDTELAQLRSDRGTIGSGILVGESRVRLNSTVETFSFYLSDNFSITDALTLTLAGRYNHTRLVLKNRHIGDDGDKLSGKHVFERFNPAVGLNYRFADYLGMYGSYSESARAPTPMELSCADPEDPCRLPNAFVADPPLEQVVAKTWEAGFRGSLARFMAKGDVHWNAGFFHTINHDDIIFNRGGDSISEGFFSNVGKTRRYGVEAGLRVDYPQLFSRIDDWHFSTNYTYLNAVFLDGFRIQNPLDMEDPAGVQVERGDRIPGIPEHLFKVAVGVDLWQRWSLGIDGIYSGDQYFRGDEANITDPLSGYWVFNLTTEINVNKYVSFFGKVNNLFDNRYETFGTFGNAEEVLGDGFDNPCFVSPGAPRAGWVGVRLRI